MRRTLVVLVSLGIGCGDSGITPEPDDGTSSNMGANSPNSTSTGVGGKGDQGGDGQGGMSNVGGEAQGGNGAGGAPTTPGGSYESGSRLKAKSYVGSDGSRVPTLSMRDSQLDADCYFLEATDGQVRCLPSSGINVIYFTDAACTNPIGYGSCPPTSNYAVQYVATGSCSSGQQRIYNLGNQITPTTIYVQSGANCVGAPAPAAYTYYSLGAEIPPSGFVSGTLEVEP